MKSSRPNAAPSAPFSSSRRPVAALLIAESDTPLGFIYLETQIDYFTGERHGHVGIIVVDESPKARVSAERCSMPAGSWARTRGSGD